MLALFQEPKAERAPDVPPFCFSFLFLGNDLQIDAETKEGSISAALFVLNLVTENQLLVPDVSSRNQRTVEFDKECAIAIYQIDGKVLRSQRRLQGQGCASAGCNVEGPSQRLAKGDAASVIHVNNAVHFAGAIRGELRNGVYFSAGGSAGKVKTISSRKRRIGESAGLLQRGAGCQEANIS